MYTIGCYRTRARDRNTSKSTNMEQDGQITSGVDDVDGIVPPTAFERLREHVRIRNQPKQDCKITASDCDYCASLTYDERAVFIGVKDAHIGSAFLRYHSTEAREIIEDAETHALNISRARLLFIKAQARRFADDEIKSASLTAQSVFHDELCTLMRRVKKHQDINYEHEACIFSRNVKRKLYSTYLHARKQGVTVKKAHKIVFAVARKFKLHSAEQLWRATKTDIVLQQLAQIHF